MCKELISLFPRYSFNVPVDAGNITPDLFAKKSIDRIKTLHLWEGNRKRVLNDLFKVDYEEDTPSENLTIRLVGDVSKLKKIGAKMSSGRVVVEGNAGMRLGEEMRGGSITVTGNADSWTGMMMKGGRIEIMGNAGDYVGTAYRGSTEGMKGGTIIIQGNAGSEVGCFMRNGLIKAHGNIGSLAGIHMRDGAILVGGNSDGRLGAEMLGGRIIVLGHVPSILPTFSVDSVRKSVRVGDETILSPFYMFTGDGVESGEGRLYVSQAKNPHLQVYEKFLVQ